MIWGIVSVAFALLAIGFASAGYRAMRRSERRTAEQIAKHNDVPVETVLRMMRGEK